VFASAKTLLGAVRSWLGRVGKRLKRFVKDRRARFATRRRDLRKAAGSKVRGAVRSNVSQVATNLSQLRESAIEPLPGVDRMPARLRELEWVRKPDGPVDAPAIVRKLSNGPRGHEARNRLGCAYALLAWEHRRDDYWLAAISELRAASEDGKSEAAKRAIRNLRRLSTESPFPVGHLPKDE
jgi:hypothetical protein